MTRKTDLPPQALHQQMFQLRYYLVERCRPDSNRNASHVPHHGKARVPKSRLSVQVKMLVAPLNVLLVAAMFVVAGMVEVVVSRASLTAPPHAAAMSALVVMVVAEAMSVAVVCSVAAATVALVMIFFVACLVHHRKNWLHLGLRDNCPPVARDSVSLWFGKTTAVVVGAGIELCMCSPCVVWPGIV